MIQVSHLTKRFGRALAVDDVSFNVRRGEIVGFLGPNGAGKSTTMRILAGYLPATQGSVKVADRDVLAESLEVRRRIGYLPESCPLYPEMRVDEYLRFRAGIKGIPHRLRKVRIQESKESCGLENEGRFIIGNLSKGFRQRVGLADALLHNPDLLILDEPTIGLDPHQIRQVRELINNLADRHTILLSTHILSEVEVTCRRVLIIDHGRIVASDSPENLRMRMKGSTHVATEIYAPSDSVLEDLNALPHVQRVLQQKKGSWVRFELECSKDVDLRQNLFELVVERGWKMRELTIEQKSLEDVFVSLTQKRPKEEDDNS